jgi:hypothetical protein
MFFDFPRGAKVDKYLSGMQTTEWHTWNNPRKEYTNAIILAAGAGDGGDGGNVLGANGGGAGAFGSIYCPLSLLPDTLYIQVGLGGAGGTGGSVGSVGTSTYVNLYPSTSTNANNLITAPYGGNAFRINNTLGVAQGYTGVSKGSGTGSGTAPSVISTTGNPIYPGAGGSGGVGGIGGGMTSASSLYPSIAGASGTTAGNNGFVIWKPFTVFGGCGAGSDGTTGGNGGNGIMGSGGGGGGAGSSINGTGGKGGDGFVIIICY